MKSAHRHELETNVLAHRLELYIMRYRPYASHIVGVVIAIIAVILIWTYVSGTSAAKRSEAWDAYNQAVAGNPPNLEEIHRAAQDNPNSKMQQMADVTWADAQVWIASRNYLMNRQGAVGALERAVSAYQGVIQSSKDERLTGRARLGLARAYEMQGHLDKARDEYRQVMGAYADYAKQQAERLEKPEAQETYTWLAAAQPPRPKAPIGPGTPGQRPEFSPGDMALPGASGIDPSKTQNTNNLADPFKDILKDLNLRTKPGDTGDRYQPGQAPSSESNKGLPATSPTAPESKGAPSAPATGTPAPTTPAAPATPTEKPAK